jgi:FkbM family methyltransferase
MSIQMEQSETSPVSRVHKLVGPFILFSRFPCARRRVFSVSARIAMLSANRILNRTFPFTLFGNVKLYARFDFGSPILAYYLGLYEESSMHFLIRYLKPQDSFADVGANVGIYTVLAAGVAGARVHAFEPFSAAYEALAQNVALNALESRATLHRQGVGASAGTAFVTTIHKGANRIVDADAGDAVEKTEIVTLDDALGDDVPAAIKIDVEGYEEQVLMGAQQVLSSPQCNAVIVEAISARDHGERVNRCVAVLERLGFKVCAFNPHSNVLLECRPGMPQFVGPNDENYLFVKDVEAARQRIGEKAATL